MSQGTTDTSSFTLDSIIRDTHVTPLAAARAEKRAAEQLSGPGQGFFECLPNDLILEILRKLDPASIRSFLRTCKYFHGMFLGECPLLRVQLHAWQRAGVRRMTHLEGPSGPRCGMLADKPGLGKTITMIAFIVLSRGLLPPLPSVHRGGLVPPNEEGEWAEFAGYVLNKQGQKHWMALLRNDPSASYGRSALSGRIRQSGGLFHRTEMEPLMREVGRKLREPPKPDSNFMLKKIGRYRCCLACGIARLDPRVVDGFGVPKKLAEGPSGQRRDLEDGEPFLCHMVGRECGRAPRQWSLQETEEHPPLGLIGASPESECAAFVGHVRREEEEEEEGGEGSEAARALADRNVQFYLHLRQRYGSGNIDPLLAALVLWAHGNGGRGVVGTGRMGLSYRLRVILQGLCDRDSAGQSATSVDCTSPISFNEIYEDSSQRSQDNRAYCLDAVDATLSTLGFWPSDTSEGGPAWRFPEGARFRIDTRAILRALALSDEGQGIPPTGLTVRYGIPTTLVVVPETLKAQWAAELEREGIAYVNLKSCEGAAPLSLSSLLPRTQRSSGSVDVVLADFQDLSNSCGDPRCVLRQCHFLRIVVDESHRLSNSAETTTLRLKNLKSLHADRRWLVTGTPTRLNQDSTIARIGDLGPLVEFLRYDRYHLAPKQLWCSKVARPFGKGERSGRDALVQLFRDLLVQTTQEEALDQDFGGRLQAWRRVEAMMVELTPRVRAAYNEQLEFSLRNLLTADVFDHNHVESFLNEDSEDQKRYAKEATENLKAALIFRPTHTFVSSDNVIETLLLLLLRLGTEHPVPGVEEKFRPPRFPWAEVQPLILRLYAACTDQSAYAVHYELTRRPTDYLPTTLLPPPPGYHDEGAQHHADFRKAELGQRTRGRKKAVSRSGVDDTIYQLANDKRYYPNPINGDAFTTGFEDAGALGQLLIRVERAIRFGATCEVPQCSHHTKLPHVGPCGCVTCLFCLMGVRNTNAEKELCHCPKCEQPYYLEKETDEKINPSPIARVPVDLIEMNVAILSEEVFFKEHASDSYRDRFERQILPDAELTRLMFLEPLAKPAALFRHLLQQGVVDSRRYDEGFEELLAIEANGSGAASSSSSSAPVVRVPLLPTRPSVPGSKPWKHWRAAAVHLLGSSEAVNALVNQASPGLLEQRKAIVFFHDDHVHQYATAKYWLDNLGVPYAEITRGFGNLPKHLVFRDQGTTSGFYWRSPGVGLDDTRAAAELSGPVVSDVADNGNEGNDGNDGDARGRARRSARSDRRWARVLETFKDPCSGVNVLLIDRTAAEGLDLSSVTDIVFMRPVEDRALEEQVIARALRLGRDKHLELRVRALVAKDTIESVLFEKRDAALEAFADEKRPAGGAIKPEDLAAKLEWRRNRLVFLELPNVRPTPSLGPLPPNQPGPQQGQQVLPPPLSTPQRTARPAPDEMEVEDGAPGPSSRPLLLHRAPTSPELPTPLPRHVAVAATTGVPVAQRRLDIEDSAAGGGGDGIGIGDDCWEGAMEGGAGEGPEEPSGERSQCPSTAAAPLSQAVGPFGSERQDRSAGGAGDGGSGDGRASDSTGIAGGAANQLGLGACGLVQVQLNAPGPSPGLLVDPVPPTANDGKVEAFVARFVQLLPGHDRDVVRMAGEVCVDVGLSTDLCRADRARDLKNEITDAFYDVGGELAARLRSRGQSYTAPDLTARVFLRVLCARL